MIRLVLVRFWLVSSSLPTGPLFSLVKGPHSTQVRLLSLLSANSFNTSSQLTTPAKCCSTSLLGFLSLLFSYSTFKLYFRQIHTKATQTHLTWPIGSDSIWSRLRTASKRNVLSSFHFPFEADFRLDFSIGFEAKSGLESRARLSSFRQLFFLEQLSPLDCWLQA